MLLSFVCEKTRSIIWWSKCTSVSASRPLRRESAPAAHSHFYRPHVWEHMSEHADAEIVSTCFLHVPIRNVLVRCLLCLWVGLHGGGRKGGRVSEDSRQWRNEQCMTTQGRVWLLCLFNWIRCSTSAVIWSKLLIPSCVVASVMF